MPDEDELRRKLPAVFNALYLAATIASEEMINAARTKGRPLTDGERQLASAVIDTKRWIENATVPR